MNYKKIFGCLAVAFGMLSSFATAPLVGPDYDGKPSTNVQTKAAEGVFSRLIGADRAEQFEILITPKSESQDDYFNIGYTDGKIKVEASSGVSACRALKWYLNNICNSSITWNGDHLNSLPEQLPTEFAKHSEQTPYKYRYMFNNCVFGYSTPFWHWEDWERMIDILAYNGINMPAMLLGQEKIWQETYKEFGLSANDLTDFFSGPAWFPWQWMGNLDGWGGPLSQEFIDKQSQLQLQILTKTRSLGMTPVQAGFSGHIPSALVKKIPDLKYHTLKWFGFGPTYILDWQDANFQKISEVFLQKQKELYGTDHYYNIDPFNEMKPPSFAPEYISNMARTICQSMLKGDPDGTWVMMTWFAKIDRGETGWNGERTKIFMDAIPNDKVLALELWGENWAGTGWHWQDGWYGKPWVWNILQNFGNRVDIYGGLDAIFNNYNKMKASPNHGDLQGMGIMTEGLGVNPIVYELVSDVMWGEGVKDLDSFKQSFLDRRYGKNHSAKLDQAWDILFEERYNQTNLIDTTPLCFPPAPVKQANFSIFKLYDAWGYMLEAHESQKDNEAYWFDLTNIGREVMGQLVANFIYNVELAYQNKDIVALRKANAELAEFIRDFDELTGSDKHFLLGKWINDAKSWASSEEEKKLLEWNAKRQITLWGGTIKTYAAKEWSGMSTKTLRQWEHFGKAREEALLTGVFPTNYQEKMDELYFEWVDEPTILPSTPTNNQIAVAKKMYEKYASAINEYKNSDAYSRLTLQQSIPGLAVNCSVSADRFDIGREPEYAVDGNTKLNQGWWAKAPASLTIDLGTPMQIGGFWLITYWEGKRCYKYTIEVSEDEIEWTTVVDNTENTQLSTQDGIIHTFNEGLGCRYVRLNMISNSSNANVHVVELKVLSMAELKKVPNK